MKPIVDITEYADIVKARVTMCEVVGGYFPDPPPRYRRIPCPLHGGTNRNFSFTDKYFKCFVCGESGDIISLTQKYFNLSFADAVKKLNHDFHVGLDMDGPTPENAARAREEAERLRAVREARARAEAAAEERYHAALSKWVRLDRNLWAYPPGSAEHDEAERKIAEASYLLDEEEMNLARIRGAYGAGDQRQS